MGTEPGWYDDGSGTTRWWDGEQWTDAARPDGGTAPPDDDPPPAPVVVPAAEPAAGTPGPTKTRRRRLALAIGGVALVAAVALAAAITVPRMLGDDAAAPQAEGTDPAVTESESPASSDSSTSSEPVLLHPEDWEWEGPPVEPQNQTERAAVDAVLLYDDAWRTQDCDAFMRASTQDWRAAIEVEDCARFAEVAAGLSWDDPPPQPALIQQRDDRLIVVGTIETHVEDEGLTEDGGPFEWRTKGSYHIVEVDDAWRVDEIHDLEDGLEEWSSPPYEAMAVETIGNWEKAIVGGDCDALFAATTVGFRDRNGLADCAALTAWVEERRDYCDLSMELTDTAYATLMDYHHTEVFATVQETCLFTEDENGDELDPPLEGEPQEVEFHLVYDWDASAWLIDNVG